MRVLRTDRRAPTFWGHGNFGGSGEQPQFDAKPAEIRALVNNQLDPARTVELDDRMLAVGLPI
nr:phosphoribulokinase [Serratia marcescens]